MKIYITGSSGNIGSKLVPHLAKHHQVIAADRDREGLEQFRGLENTETRVIDIADRAVCQQEIRNVDMVVHLAGNPKPDATFDDVLEPNIIGTYNVLSAAAENGVRRVIFASTIHVIDGYPDDKQVETYEMVRPGDIYGVSKAFGEALCSYYAFHEGIETIAVRINAFEGIKADGSKIDVDPRSLSTFLHPDDFNALIDKCLEVEMREPYYVVHATSNNRFKRMSMLQTKLLLDGYEPEYDAFEATDIDLEKAVSTEEVDKEVIADK